MNDTVRWGMTIFFGILVILILVTPIIVTITNIIYAAKNKKKAGFEACLYGIGTLLMVDMSGGLPDYTLPVNLAESLGLHQLISKNHIGTICAFILIGISSYFVLKFYKKEYPPLLSVILIAGVYIGCTISLLIIIQLMGAVVSEVDMRLKLINSYSYYEKTGFIFYMVLIPLNYLVNAIALLVWVSKEKANHQIDRNYKNRFINVVNNCILRCNSWHMPAFVVMIPFIIIVVMILCLFGQQPDSVIKAFTQTSDWMLSKQTSPPPIVHYSSHYLCTVSLRGHKRLVKPIRYGIRGGEKIVVNRQLCIANAFEELIMERTPRFHKLVRDFYDRYGYPISKLIRTAWLADLTYLIMKPLEWIFLITIYMCDKKPENRIARQYLPKNARIEVKYEKAN